MAFLDNILLLCEQNGEKLTPLMKQLKLSPGNVQRWRDGATINSEILGKFSNHFKVSVDFLLNGVEYISPDEYENRCATKDEKELLSMFRSLPESLQALCLNYVKSSCDTYRVMQEEEKRLLG